MDDVGIADFGKSLILLKRGMTKEAKDAAFVHEAMHHMNTTLPHTTLDSLAEQVYQFIRQVT